MKKKNDRIREIFDEEYSRAADKLAFYISDYLSEKALCMYSPQHFYEDTIYFFNRVRDSDIVCGTISNLFLELGDYKKDVCECEWRLLHKAWLNQPITSPSEVEEFEDKIKNRDFPSCLDDSDYVELIEFKLYIEYIASLCWFTMTLSKKVGNPFGASWFSCVHTIKEIEEIFAKLSVGMKLVEEKIKEESGSVFSLVEMPSELEKKDG